MDTFVVSARKYRPATFNTVVGQSAITTTLKNAIKNNHLAQAFLFCGPRGVGKTTCARILAKTINCTNLTKDTEACDKCESCQSFNTGQSFNVYELDAASNNSVDDIRNLVDQVRIPPQMGQYKVYIIDEVHMLSAGAFNAFLKTLEEPPKYAIFILATTERHKILPTILSRCQVFNFNRIQVDDIANHLAFIAKSENVNAEPDALHVIAQKADGALRDACSIFDQVVSFSGNNLTYKNVIENLNVLDYDYYFKTTDLLLAADIPKTLLVFNEILSNGFDGHNFISGLAEHFRNLLVCKDPQTIPLLEVGQNIKEKYKVQSQKCSHEFLLRALSLVNKCDVGYKSARNPRLLVEFTLMQLTALSDSSVLAGAEKKNDDSDLIFGLRSKPVSENAVQHSAAEVSTTLSVPNVAEVKQPVAVAAEPVTQVKQQQTNTSNLSNTSNQPTQVTKKPILKGGPTIGSFLTNNQKKEEAVVEVGVEIKNPFTQEQLDNAWKKYIAHLRNINRVSDANILIMGMPKMVNEDQIIFSVPNASNKESIETDKTTLMGFLRAELKNNVFKLDVVVEQKSGTDLPYTNKDKYDYMLKINPALAKLKSTFDLDEL
jgi:DNA polymerase-3 subunit gamma/tau